MEKTDIIFKDINVFLAIKGFKIAITKLMIFTKIFGKNMYMIDVLFLSYQNGIKRVEIGLLIGY